VNSSDAVEGTGQELFLSYRVRARNTSVDSENKIHDDAVAASYGFRGGLVPGITVYAYMTVPLVERFGLGWLERGSMQVKFHQPFYDGEEVIVSGRVDGDSEPIKVSVTAERSDGTVCATALATMDDRSDWLGELRLADYPEASLAEFERRPEASRESFVPGARLGTLTEKFDLPNATLLESLDERLPIYYGSQAVAHPFALLRLSNQVLMSNFKLGPWIHAASDLTNRSVVHNGDEVSTRGRIRERFERKGHQLVVLDVLVVANRDRVVQQVRHTAIYEPRLEREMSDRH
jgi:acyl dehydratase